MLKCSRFYFVLIALFASLGLNGCAIRQTIDASALQRIKTVGVVSLLGEDVHLQFQGTTAFGNRSQDEHAPDFALDVTAEHAAKEALAGQYRVDLLGAAGRAALPPSRWREEGLISFTPALKYWSATAAEVGPIVRGICASRHLNALVVIYPGFVRSDIEDFRGVGFAGANVWGHKDFFPLGVICVAVYDDQGILLKETMVSRGLGMQSRITEFGWQSSLSIYTPEQRRLLITKLQELVTQDTKELLHFTGLVR